jgi:hypothetical protein
MFEKTKKVLCAIQVIDEDASKEVTKKAVTTLADAEEVEEKAADSSKVAEAAVEGQE